MTIQTRHSDKQDSRVFAVAYTGAVIDLKADEQVDGKKVYELPALNYDEAFGEVCKVVDEHPELWKRPSRDAVTFAVGALRASEAGPSQSIAQNDLTCGSQV